MRNRNPKEIVIVTDDLKFGKRVKELVEEVGTHTFAGFVSTERNQYSYREHIIGDVIDLANYTSKEICVAIAIQDNQKRKSIFKFLKKNKNIFLESVLHPNGRVWRNTTFERGVIAFKNCSFLGNTKIKRLTIIEEDVIIGSNCRIDKYCSLGKKSSIGTGTIMMKESALSENSHLLDGGFLNTYEKTEENTIYFVN